MSISSSPRQIQMRSLKINNEENKALENSKHINCNITALSYFTKDVSSVSLLKLLVYYCLSSTFVIIGGINKG